MHSDSASDRRIDRNWTGVGRVRLRTARLTWAVHHGLNEMLSYIKRVGRVDLWQALAGNAIDPLTLYTSYRLGELGRAVAVGAFQSAKAEMLEWLAQSELSSTTRRSYYQYINDLFREHPDATVPEIPAVLVAVSERCKLKGHKTTFGRCKAVALSYVSKSVGAGFGKRSPLWLEIAAVRGPEKSSFVKTGIAREVWDVVACVKKMRQPYGQMFWTMCLIGAGNKEYLHDGFKIEPNQQWVTVLGQKNANRVRRTPFIYGPLTQPTRSLKPFRAALHEVQEDWTLYDARRSFLHWCEEAGIPKVRYDMYVGHKTKTVSEGYRRHDVTPYLLADAERLRDYIDAHRKEPKTKSIVATVPDFNWHEDDEQAA